MAKSTGPILVMGTVTLVNASIIHSKPVDWRIPIATGLTAGIAALAEKGFPALVTGLAWLALMATLLVRVQPDVPSPTETFLTYWETGGLSRIQ